MADEKDLQQDTGQETTQEPVAEETVETTEANKAQEPKAEGEAAAEPEQTGDDKKGFFGKKKNDKEKQLKEQIDGLEDRVKRQMAEFDNFRKRTEKEKEQMFSMGEKSAIEKMLPIVDNFERGFDTVTEEDKDDAFVAGMHKVYDQLMKQLADLGVKPIEAVGKEFDPNLHNAVMQVESDQYESGVVAQELQKGYMYRDSVLRHSMVSVVS